MPAAVDVRVVEGSSERVTLPDGTADIVLTDPPYHDDVQYGELSMPLRVWSGLPTLELTEEAVATSADNDSYDQYRALLTRIFAEARRALATDAHLIFSYANREPDAWVSVLSALHEAGFQAAGYAVVHSENETDHAKRNVRACSMDLILDLVPIGQPVQRWRPHTIPSSHEGAFLRLVGDTMLANVGVDGDDWVEKFRQDASAHPFIA